MSSAVVRDGGPDDVAAVQLLLHDAFAVYADLFGRRGRDVYLADVMDLEGRAASAEVLVAEVAGELVGSVTFLPDGAFDAHPWPPGGSVLRLLAVHAGWRRHGLGSVLTNACIERATVRGSAFVGLHTAPFMEGAAPLYERLGFLRAPEYDFDPGAHYGRPAGDGAEDPLVGHAYVLPLRALGPPT